MRIVFTDGEMSNLSADFGQLLCACTVEYNPADRKKPWANLQTFILRDYDNTRWDDKSLAMAWRNSLEDYDIAVTWNGIRFDVPFLETRCRRWSLKSPAIPRHKDLLYTARYKMRLHANKLDDVAEHLQIERKYHVKKTRMEPERWTMALGGHKPSYNYIITHCQNDVKVLACIWEEIKHLVTNIGENK